VMSPLVPTPAAKTAQTATGRVRWLLAALTLLAMVGTASLGAWQLRRAHTKEALAAQIEDRNRLPELTNSAQAAIKNVGNGAQPMAAQTDFLHRRVQLQGTWLHARTVFLDNRFMGGKPGFVVATPLQLEQSVVWVQRGWVPRDPSERTRLPSLPASQGRVVVQGRVIEAISRVYALGEPGADQATPALASSPIAATATASAPAQAGASSIWQNLPTLDFGVANPLLPVAVLQTAASQGDAPDGLLRDWPAVDTGVAKHYGYAFQWFALCGLIMVLYVWFQLLAPRRRHV
jgi:surfeit locus 1 family protein